MIIRLLSASNEEPQHLPAVMGKQRDLVKLTDVAA